MYSVLLCCLILRKTSVLRIARAEEACTNNPDPIALELHHSISKVCAPDPIARATALLSYILTQPADGDVCHRATASADKKWGPTSSAHRREDNLIDDFHARCALLISDFEFDTKRIWWRAAETLTVPGQRAAESSLPPFLPPSSSLFQPPPRPAPPRATYKRGRGRHQ